MRLRRNRRWRCRASPLPVTRRDQLLSPLPCPAGGRHEHAADLHLIVRGLGQHPLLALNVLATLPVADGPPLVAVADPDGPGDGLVDRVVPDFLVDRAVGGRHPDPAVAGWWRYRTRAWDGDEARPALRRRDGQLDLRRGEHRGGEEYRECEQDLAIHVNSCLVFFDGPVPGKFTRFY